MRTTAKKNYGEVIRGIEGSAIFILIHIVCFVCGMFSARTVLFKGMLLLGVALPGGISPAYLMSGALGAFTGYLFPAVDGTGFRYIAALFAVTCIRFLTKEVKGIKSKPLWLALWTFLSVLTTGLVSNGVLMFNTVSTTFAESIISAAITYFVSVAMGVNYLEVSGITNREFAAFTITVNIVFLGLYSFTVAGISIGHILAVVFIYIAAKYSGTGAGAISGIAVAASMLVSGTDISIAFIYCVAGLIVGFFSTFSKPISILMFTVVVLTMVLVVGLNAQTAAVITESVLGGLVYLVLPKSLSVRLGAIISPPANLECFDGLRQTLVMRLEFASGAMQGVAGMVDRVAQILNKNDKQSFNTVLNEVEKQACKGCLLCVNCWEKNRDETVQAMLEMAATVKKGEPMCFAKVPENFAERCLRRESVENALNINYSEFLSARVAEQRIKEMREVVSDQFEGISDMLYDLAVEFSQSQTYDIKTAEKVTAALKSLDLRAVDCGCCIDKYGRMSLEIRLKHSSELPIGRSRILAIVEEICEREFEPPTVNRVGDQCLIRICEKAVLAADCAFAQINSKSNMMCGDSAEHFVDSKGHLYMVLSDGMGTGGRAAVDSAMALGLMSKLLKSGFGYDCSLRIVNSAMQFKSSDESLATVDISVVDLFTGKAELLKAGAAPTIVRKSGRTGRAQCKSLPIGILRDVGFDRAEILLKPGDIIVMMSDGVTVEGTDWICAELEKWQDGSAKQLCDHLAVAARRRRKDLHEDDITVMVAILEKAV
ncbi:MAG: SpoIIE family protein phosphatase [bacterium]|nr:SpoIIE family protein phosphatase [bacterium]